MNAGLGVLVGAMAFPSFAERVKITVERGNASRVYLVGAGESHMFGNIQKLAFPATTGDCSGYDTSKLARDAKDGDGLRLSTSKSIHGSTSVALEYEHYQFLGTRPHQFTASCVVNNPSSNIETFSQTVVLRKGAPPRLLRSTPVMKVFGSIE